MRNYLLLVFVFIAIFTSSLAVSAQIDSTAPVLTSLRAENLTGTSAQIRWNTDDPSSSQLAYGTTTTTLNTFLDTASRCDLTESGYPYVTHHCINLTNLVSGMVYYYKAQSTNTSGLFGFLISYFTSANTSGSGSSGGSGGTSSPTPTPIPDYSPTPTPTPSSSSGPTVTPTPNISPTPMPSLNNIPLPPSNLHGTVLGNKAVLTWTDNYNNETEYRMYRKSSSTATWSFLRVLSANTVSYMDDGLSIGSYDYDISACNSYGCSAYSNIATVMVGATGSFDTKTVAGKVIFSNGQAVTDAEVGAYSLDTGFWVSKQVDSGGYYSFTLSGGKWQIGVRPKNPLAARWSFSSLIEFEFVRDSSVESKTFTTTIPVSDNTLTVYAVDGSGAVLSNAGIEIGAVSAGESSPSTASGTSLFGKTDSSGKAVFVLRSGTYYVRGFLPTDSGYINPSEQVISFASGESKEVKMTFTKKTISTTLFIKGSTKLGDGMPTDAYVWAWSEKGRSVNAHSTINGEFSLQVPSDDKWHIGAGKMIDNIPYKSSEVIVYIGDATVSIELILAKFAQISGPATVTQSATREIITTTQDGAKVTVPANTVATTDPITVEVKPTIEAPSQPSARVVGNAYNVSVKNPTGQELKEFGKEIIFELPYKESDLQAQGISEDKIAPSFYDETTGTWVRVDNYTVDKDRNVIIARIMHLTLFAVVLAADIVPPSPPTLVKGSAIGGGQIVFTWVNPVGDFDHINIYRSENLSSLGRLEGTTKDMSFTDDLDVKNGVTYYYVLRSVDAAGNETSNTTSTAVKAIGDSLKTSSSSMLKDGDMISAAGSDDPDIYIINNYGYKRLFLNPVIFSFYGHLGGFKNVKSVNSSSRDSYKTSGLFRNCETDDPMVYGVQVTGEDSGSLHWINISGSQAAAEDADFFKKVFCINNNEFKWYSKSSNYVSLGQVPNYSR